MIYEMGWVFIFLNIDFIVGKYGSERAKATWDRLTHPHWGWKVWVIGALGIALLFLLEGSYRNHRDTQAKISERDVVIEGLAWPADRPKLSLTRWGKRPDIAPYVGDTWFSDYKGFYVENDGGAALEVLVESFEISKNLVVVSEPVARIEGGKQGFIPVWIKDEVRLSKFALDIALERGFGETNTTENIFVAQPFKLPISIIYRDYNDLWYRSKVTLMFIFDSYFQNRIEFGAVEQERLGSKRPFALLQ